MEIRVQTSVLVQEPSPQEQLIHSKCHDNFIQEIIYEIIHDEDQQRPYKSIMCQNVLKLT